MTEFHLTQETLDQYRSGKLASVDEALGVEAHLSVCGVCRERLQALISGAGASLYALLHAADTPVPCPDRTLLNRYANGQADALDREFVETHLEGCASCSAALALISAREPAPAGRQSSSARRMFGGLSWREARLMLSSGIAATVLAILLRPARTIVPTRSGGEGRPLPSQAEVVKSDSTDPHFSAFEPNVRADNKTSKWLAEARQAQADAANWRNLAQRAQAEAETNKRKWGQAQTEAKRLEAQISEQQARIASLQGRQNHDGSIVLPADIKLDKNAPALAMLHTVPRIVRGADEEQVSLISPIDSYVLERRPRFQWKPVSNADRYEFTITPLTNGDSEAAAPPVPLPKEATERRITRNLQPGTVYEWKVAAFRENEDTAFAFGSARCAFVQIADTGLARMLSAEHQRLGTLYQKAGLQEDAEREFRAARLLRGSLALP